MDRFAAITGDITTLTADAIVNAANPSLLGGGGVDGAIHRAGGPAILEACRRLRAEQYPDGLPVGEAVATTAGALHASWVIHTVGPVWHGGGDNEHALLARAVDATMQVAGELGARSIAFPAISTGVYGFPRELAYPILDERIRAGLARYPAILRASLVFFAPADLALFTRLQRGA